MKKSFMIVFLVALLAFVLPMSVFAGKRQNFEVSVRNRSGASAMVIVVNEQGQSSNFQLPAGYSTIQLEEGKYDYYVTTACGNSAGRWNLNVDKTLWVVCTQVAPVAQLVIQKGGVSVSSCVDYGFFVDYAGWVEFNSQTNWVTQFISWEQHLQNTIDTGRSPVLGCIHEYGYNEYFLTVP